MTKMLSALFGSFLVLWCFGCSTLTRAEREKMTVLSYNIHHGAGTDGKLDLERIARIIREQRADLVALQEVDVKAWRSGGVDEAAELGRLIAACAACPERRTALFTPSPVRHQQGDRQ